MLPSLVTNFGNLTNELIAPETDSTIEVRAPGRINLIGEHTDYNGGKVLPCAIESALSIALTPTNTNELRIISPTLGRYAYLSLCTLETLVSRPIEADEVAKLLGESAWSSYVVGAWVSVARMCRDSGLPLPGACTLTISSTIPLGGGLSSSAALCVASLKAFQEFVGVSCSDLDLAILAMKIEHTYAGTRCGLMDQLAIVTAKQGMFSLIDFLDENHPCISLIPAHTTLKDYTLTAIDSCVAHSLASGEYNKRRADCEKAVAAFNQHTKLNYNTLGQFCTQAAFEKLWDLPRTHSSIGQILQDVFPTPTQEQVRLVKRARHALSEILRVETAASALATNDLTNLASTMTAAHLSLCNDYEVSCSEIEALRSEAIQIADRLARKAGIESSIPAIIGPRLCGGGFGGSIVQLVHKSIAPDFTEHFRSYSDYEKHFAVKPKVMITSIANGISSSQRPHLAA